MTTMTIELDQPGLAATLKALFANMEGILSVSVSETETSLYNAAFVEKIKSQEDMPSLKVNTEDLWK